MSLTTDVRIISGTTRSIAAACGAVALLLVTSACGSTGDGTRNASDGSHQQGGPQGDSGGTTGRFPGANGKIAAVDGSTAQVQGPDGQVAVTWGATTAFTKDVSATLAAVKVGSCVLVSPAGEPTSSSMPTTELTAASVRISPKTDGSCRIGGPGGPPGSGGLSPQGGQAGSGGDPQLNGTPPSDAPEGGPRPQVRMVAGAVGEVTAVSASGFTVASVTPDTDDKTSVAVTVGSDTTYTTTATGAATDVKVGMCLAATGTTDQTGAVTAKTVNLSQPVDGQCGGLMRFKSGAGTSTENS